MELPHDSTIPLLGISKMAILLHIYFFFWFYSQLQKDGISLCLSTDEGIVKMCYIHIMGCYYAMKKEGVGRKRSKTRRDYIE